MDEEETPFAVRGTWAKGQSSKTTHDSISLREKVALPMRKVKFDAAESFDVV